MKLLTLSLASLLFFACSSPNNSGKIESLKVLQSCVLGKYAEGNQELGSMLDLAKDKTNLGGLNDRANRLCEAMKQADSLSFWLISELNSIRQNIISKKSDTKEKDGRPVRLKYSSKIELSAEALPNQEKIKGIIKELEIYRNELCRVVTETPYIRPPDEPYYFRNPSIASFKNDEEKAANIREALTTSHMNAEDLYRVTQIMEVLTEQESTWESMLSVDQDWVDLSMGLLSIQHKVLTARWYAFRNINLRIGCRANYNITTFAPVVLGSTNALPNDTVKFEVLLVGYNEYFDQKVTVSNGARFIKYEDGKAVFEAFVPDSGELDLTGEISIQRKNGDYSSPRKWSHTISVLKEE